MYIYSISSHRHPSALFFRPTICPSAFLTVYYFALLLLFPSLTPYSSSCCRTFNFHAHFIFRLGTRLGISLCDLSLFSARCPLPSFPVLPSIVILPFVSFFFFGCAHDFPSWGIIKTVFFFFHLFPVSGFIRLALSTRHLSA